jgi:hypothetical protein
MLSIQKAPTDIFPSIDIPVITVIWNYGGLPPQEMERRVANNFERFLTTIVADVEHVESQTLTGNSITKIYLQPGADVTLAIAQTTAVAQTAVRGMPPGSVPPLIMRYSATSVPIMMLALETDSLSEQQLFDYGINFIRSEIATIRGAQVPYPYGGKQRQIMVDIDPARLHALGMSPREVQAALGQQNVILPSGTAKVGTVEYQVVVHATPDTLDELAGLPVKSVDGRMIYLRDVANVRDGGIPQTSMVHVEGHVRSERVRACVDQRRVIRSSDRGRPHRADDPDVPRQTITVIVSIPLSILFSIIVLRLFDETINVMTLGGLGSERTPVARAAGVFEGDRAIRGHDHGAHDRSRHARRREHRDANVHARRHRSSAHLHRRAAVGRAERAGRHGRQHHGARIRGAHVRGQGHARCGCARSRAARDDHGDPGAESRQRAAARHVRADRADARGSASRARDSVDGAV